MSMTSAIEVNGAPGHSSDGDTPSGITDPETVHEEVEALAR